MSIPTLRAAAGRVGGASQRAAARPDDLDAQREHDEARRDLAVASIADTVRKRLADRLPLLPEQVHDLTELVRSYGEDAAADRAT